MKKLIQDSVISYLIRHQAPGRITYSSDRETRIFGFWVYLGARGDQYVILKRTGHLEYECNKIDAPEDEAGQKILKYITIKDGYSFSKDVTVRLYHNGSQISNLSPLRAFVYGVTGFYRFLIWRENLRFRKSAKNNEKAYSFYCDRLRLLELIIDVRNKQHEENTLFPDKISRGTLLKSIARASVVTSQGYYTYIEPILKGLEEEKAISISGDKELEIKAKAWRLVSDYYVDERRHKDNQKSLKWQRYLTGLLAIVSIGNIFKDELRGLFGL